MRHLSNEPDEGGYELMAFVVTIAVISTMMLAIVYAFPIWIDKLDWRGPHEIALAAVDDFGISICLFIIVAMFAIRRRLILLIGWRDILLLGYAIFMTAVWCAGRVVGRYVDITVIDLTFHTMTAVAYFMLMLSVSRFFRSW